MIPLEINTESTARISRPEWEASSATAWTEAGKLWLDRILPKRFSPSAQIEYGFQARAAGYDAMKRNAKGHRRALVFTGKLEAATHRSREVSTARSQNTTAARVRLTVPDYVTRTRRPGSPDLEAELGAVTERDAVEIARVVERELAEALSREGETRQPG